MKCPFCDCVELSERLIIDSPNYMLFPTLGCFVEDYTLIVSKNHILSVASQDDDLLCDLDIFTTKVFDIYRNKLKKNFVVFEHGLIDDFGSGANTVNHLHLYILPYESEDFNDIKTVLDIPFEEIFFVSFVDLKQSILDKNFSSYLFFQDVSGKRYLADITNRSSQSQFFRRIFAERIGNSQGVELNYDWWQHTYMENMQKTLDNFRLKINI